MGRTSAGSSRSCSSIVLTHHQSRDHWTPLFPTTCRRLATADETNRLQSSISQHPFVEVANRRLDFMEQELAETVLSQQCLETHGLPPHGAGRSVGPCGGGPTGCVSGWLKPLTLLHQQQLERCVPGHKAMGEEDLRRLIDFWQNSVIQRMVNRIWQEGSAGCFLFAKSRSWISSF